MQISPSQQSETSLPDATEARVVTPQKPGSLRVVVETGSPYGVLLADLSSEFLNWQCRMIAGVMRGAMFAVGSNGELGQAHAQWPDSVASAGVLTEVALAALRSGQSELTSKVSYTRNKGQVCDAVACPIIFDGQIVAVASVALATRALPQQKAVQHLIEWGANWFTTLIEREANSQKERAPLLLDLLKNAIQQESLPELTKTSADLLAQRTASHRVSIAVSRGGRMQLHAVSGLPEFDRRSRFATRLEDAMEEAADQHAAVQFPAEEQAAAIDRAHRRLGDVHPNTRFYTVTAEHENVRLGLVIEIGRDSAFTQAQTELFDEAAILLAESAALINSAQGSLGAWAGRGRQSIEKRVRGRFGFWALVVAAIITITAFIPSTHRVTAQAELISQEQRAVVASIAGYIETAHVRPGDDVKEGDLLATLDTRDLELEADKWRSLRGARQVEYQEALATRDRSQISVLRARLEQIDAELNLVNAQVSRAQMHAPYTGVVISGDLSQALNAPVKQGEVLFEIAPLTGYRVIMEVNEYDLASVKSGATGYLRLAAMPQMRLPFTVNRIMPVAESGDGYSFFRVEAHVSELPPELRPGMRGVAKIEAGQKSLLWRWTHTVIDRVRLLVWSLGL